MKSFAWTVEVFSSSTNVGYVEYPSSNYRWFLLARLYQLSDSFIMLPFTSLLALLRLLFPISKLQSFLASCTGGRNIRTGGTAMYIFIAMACNTTLHLSFNTCATTCETPCSLPFAFTIHGYFLGSTFLGRNGIESDFFTWRRLRNAKFNRIRKRHRLRVGVISVQNSMLGLNAISVIKALDNLAKYTFVVRWSSIQGRYCNADFISNGKNFDCSLFTILTNWSFICVKLIGVNMSSKSTEWFCGFPKRLWIQL